MPNDGGKRVSEANPIDRVVINFVKNNPGSSIKNVELNRVFQSVTTGSPTTVDIRLSRRLASLYKKGKLNRRKIAVGPGYDGTRWVYAYD